MNRQILGLFAPHHRQPVFFVHIPKCGGTSIWGIVRRNYGPKYTKRKRSEEREVNHFTPDPANLRFLNKRTAIGGHIHVGEARKMFPTRLNFTFVREPVARLKSHFAHQRLGQITAEHGPDAVDVISDEILKYAQENNRQTILRDYMTYPYLEPGTGVAAIAEQMQKNFGLICMTETFDKSLLLMQAVLKWPEEPNYVRRNVRHSHRLKLRPDAEAQLKSILASEQEVYLAAKQVSEMHMARHGADITPEKVDAFRAVNQQRMDIILTENEGLNPFDKTQTPHRSRRDR